MVDARDRFERLVIEAVDALPGWIHRQIDNVEVLVEEDPPEHQRGLLGLYEGVPLTKRSPLGYSGVLPDRITLYRRPIERLAGDEAQLERLIRHTIVHEFAHYFGISDDRLRELDRY
jgi:predicted Zn-dependent protease with MMP-like domain